MTNFEDFEELQLNFETKQYNDIEEWKFFEMQNNRNSFNLLHINIGIMNQKKMELLKAQINDIIKKIDILIITEFGIEKDASELYKLRNFNLYTFCRVNRKGGGIAIYSKEKLKTIELKTFTFKNAESVIIEIQNKNIILNAIYRPPKQNPTLFIEEMNKWLKMRFIKNKEIIIIGDININTLKNNSICHKYIETLYNHKIMNAIQIPTREEIVENQLSATCIDHVNIRIKKKIYSCSNQ